MLKALFVLALGLVVVPVSGCVASCNGFKKTWSSELNGGIQRTADVYSYSGTPLRAYKGQIDIETTDSSHVQLMLNGTDRVSINNAIVIIEDK